MKVHISWEEFHRDCNETATKVYKQLSRIDYIVGIARGGLVPARIMAEVIKPEGFYVIGVKLYDEDSKEDKITLYQDIPDVDWSGRNVLIVDDISDGGTTLEYAIDQLERTNGHIYTATPYIKSRTIVRPDVYAKEYDNDKWLVFPFECD